jgi:hypothetical protein
MWLLSLAEVDENTVVVRVTDDLQHLEVYIKLPSILDIQRVDERNARLYVEKITGSAIYAPTHVRSIAQKRALLSLPRTKDGFVYFKQTIHLPFKVTKNPQLCNGYDGIQYKCYEGGLIKQLVVELVSAAYKPKNSVPNFPKETENIGFATLKPSSQAAANQSVFSLNRETGKRNSGLPAVVEVNQECSMSGTYYSNQSKSTHTGRRSRRSGNSDSRRTRHRSTRSTSSRTSYTTGFSTNSSKYNNTAGTRSEYSRLDDITEFQGSYGNDGTLASRRLDRGSSRDGSRRSRDRGLSRERDRGTFVSRRNDNHRSALDYSARPRSITTESATNNVIMDDISEEDPNEDGNDWYMD